MSPIALRAYPQAKSPFPQIDFSEIHGRPIVGTSDSGNRIRFIRDSVLAQDEVSAISVVVDETIGLRTGIRKCLCRVVTFAVQGVLIKPHLHMMLMTKRPKLLARLGSRHRPFSRTPPNELPFETVYQWNALVPLDFGLVSQYVVSYASGVHVSRAYSPESTEIGRVRSGGVGTCVFRRTAKTRSARKDWSAQRTCQKNCLIRASVPNSTAHKVTRAGPVP